MINNLKPRLFAIGAVVLLLIITALVKVTTMPSKDKMVSLKSSKPAVITGFRVNGVLQDDNGKPVPNAKVYALWETLDAHGDWCIRDTSISDKTGQFTFKSLPWIVREREYILIAYMPGRFLGQISTRIYSNVGSRNQRNVDADLVIHMHRLGSFTGRVVDQKGRGLNGVKVQPIEMVADDQLFRPETLKDIMIVPEAISDPHGNYKLLGVPDGFRLMVTAKKRGYAQYPRPYDSKANHVVMMPSARVHGKLIDQTGKGIPDVNVWADAEKFDGHGRTKTDRNGIYEFDLYPAGIYAISAPEMKELLAKGLRNVRVEIGKTVEAQKIVAMRPVSLRGRVLDLSKLDENRSFVNLRPESYYCPLAKSTLVDKHNIYKHKVLPGETYRIEYRGLGLYKRNEGRSRTVKVSKYGDDRVDLRLQKVPTALGYITDQFGLPIQDACVSLPGYGPIVAAGPFYGATTTGPDGKFEIGISPILAARTSGLIKIYAYQNERHLARVESVDVKTLLGNGLKLSLKPVNTLKVIVLGNGNKPVPGATVYITPEFPGRGSIETDRHGQAIFDVYPGFRYYLTARNRYGSKRYPQTGETRAVGDKDWKSEVSIRLH